MGISCDQLWFHSWIELGFTSSGVSISVQGISASSPIGCKTPATKRGALPRKATGSCEDSKSDELRDSNCPFFSFMSVFHFFFPELVSDFNFYILSANVP